MQTMTTTKPPLPKPGALVRTPRGIGRVVRLSVDGAHATVRIGDSELTFRREALRVRKS